MGKSVMEGGGMGRNEVGWMGWDGVGCGGMERDGIGECDGMRWGEEG